MGVEYAPGLLIYPRCFDVYSALYGSSGSGSVSFAFTARVFRHAVLLVIGSILAPGRRTVTAALRMLGLEASSQVQNYHRTPLDGQSQAQLVGLCCLSGRFVTGAGGQSTSRCTERP